MEDPTGSSKWSPTIPERRESFRQGRPTPPSTPGEPHGIHPDCFTSLPRPCWRPGNALCHQPCGNNLIALLTHRGRRNRRSRSAQVLSSLCPDLNPVSLVARPWSILQYPVALIMAWTELAGVSTTIIHIPSDRSSVEFSFLGFGYQIDNPIILLSSGHFAGVAACNPSRTPQQWRQAAARWHPRPRGLTHVPDGRVSRL